MGSSLRGRGWGFDCVHYGNNLSSITLGERKAPAKPTKDYWWAGAWWQWRDIRVMYCETLGGVYSMAANV